MSLLISANLDCSVVPGAGQRALKEGEKEENRKLEEKEEASLTPE